MESAARALRSDGRSLAVYNANGGSLGYLPLRQFLCGKAGPSPWYHVSPDEVLITSGSQQGIIAVMDAFLDPGDTVVY